MNDALVGRSTRSGLVTLGILGACAACGASPDITTLHPVRAPGSTRRRGRHRDCDGDRYRRDHHHHHHHHHRGRTTRPGRRPRTRRPRGDDQPAPDRPAPRRRAALDARRSASEVRAAPRCTDPSAGNADIFLMRADGTTERQLTDHQARDVTPRSSPDGDWVASRADRDGNAEIYGVVIGGLGPTVAPLENGWRMRRRVRSFLIAAIGALGALAALALRGA
jgi:hypothetical protein